MKVMISACLAGENVKYNGGNNRCGRLLELLKDHEVITVCPEVLGGLSIPRVPSEICGGTVLNRDGVNVDSAFRKGAERTLGIALKERPDLVILQPRSPSCGVTTRYDGTFSGKLVPGAGVTAQLLKEHGFRVLEEGAPELEEILKPKRKHLVLLHSNDIHGEFNPKDKDGLQTGGISLLSGYVRRTRQEEKNVIYAMAGDLFMGSIIDQEYKGMSTIRFANAIEPDVFTVGNHEVDYGLSHLLFLEKCSDFPIVCANIYARELGRRMFAAYTDVLRDEVRVRFIGLLTESIADKIRQEDVVDSAVGVRDVRKELDKVLAETKGTPADLTILLTHIGIVEDRILAESLGEDSGVDLIIGGHSHTFMEQPEIVNNIPIVQAGWGSGQIGRFDIDIEPGTHRFSYTWQCVPVNEQTSENDLLMDFYADRIETEIREKYEKKLTTLAGEYTHPGFHRETQLLDLFCDMCQDAFGTDVFIISSNSLRAKTLGPEFTRKQLLAALPYDNEVFKITLEGRRLRCVFEHLFRSEAWTGTNVFFLFSKNLTVDYSRSLGRVTDVLFQEKPLEDDRLYTLGMTSYARRNPETFLGIPAEELGSRIPLVRLSTNDRESLENYLSGQPLVCLEKEGRLRVSTD